MGEIRPDICVLSNPRSDMSPHNPGAVDRAMAVFGEPAELRAFYGDPTDEAERAVQDGFRVVIAAGVDLVLSGHSHMPHMGLADTATGVLFLQVGSALSTRLETGSNDLTLLGLSPRVATVESWLSPPGARGFDPGPGRTYRRQDGVWKQVEKP
ncbi:MAG: hypothetical protein ACK4FR_11610 [Tabrizicola sp.]